MKVGVVTFPGSNCDTDLIRAFQAITGTPAVRLWHRDCDLQGCELVCLPGGFSYGDYLRPGAIARFSPIVAELHRHAASGRLILGICNGFQILTEAQLLPGVLLRNTSGLFICTSTWLKPVSNVSKLSRQLRKKCYQIPIAHADGRYYCDDNQLKALQDNGQILFQYCDTAGNITSGANPNGSIGNIAGVCNRSGNVMAMMPHPERVVSPLLGGTDGIEILSGLLAA
jgi:phosphoribosylformylglycinamidine synthase